jgi:hypothetical protein
MKRRLTQVVVFCASCAATAAVWNQLRTDTKPLPSDRLKSSATASRTITEDLHSVLIDLGSAETSEARLKAARRLDQISVDQIRSGLEEAPFVDHGQLSLVAKLLLIRWAGEDGEAAVNWAWKNLRSKGVWKGAYREIIAAWAWSQPAKLCEWAKRSARDNKPVLGEVSLADAEQSDIPLLDFEGLNDVSRCLVSLAPREAHEVLLIRGGFSSDDSELTESLQSVSAVQEALLAFDGLENLQPDRWSGSEIHANSLLHRWKELDPVDFKRSRFAHLIPDRSPLESASRPAGPRGWISEFNEWTSIHPSAPPDVKDWSPEKIEAWKDYQAWKNGWKRSDE